MTDKAQTPKWRRDFPTTWNDDNYITRRDFARYLVLTSGAFVVGNAYFVVNHPGISAPANDGTEKVHISIATVAELAVGAVKLFHFPTENDPAILIRTSESEFVAYRQRCSHLSCPVIYNHPAKTLDCPCHNGAFEASTGRVLSGPPPSALPKIALVVENGQIYAAGWEERT